MTARQFHIGLLACSRTKADRLSSARELYERNTLSRDAGTRRRARCLTT